MTTHEGDSWVFYRVACDCGEPNCDLTVELEIDKELPNMLFMNFHKNLEWSSYHGDANLFVRIWRRIKCACKVLFTGYIEVQESHIFQGYAHIKNFIEVMHEAATIMVENSKAAQRDSVSTEKSEERSE